MAAGGRLLSVDFEVFGKVQGVFFRNNTKKTADSLKLVGWVKNSSKDHNKVLGHMEGPVEKITEMKHWLSKVGSKSSRIDRAEFTNEKTIDKCTMKDFIVKR